MRVMVLIKADKNTETGVMLAGEGLHPSSKGVRLRFSGASRTVTKGPFAETKQLVAGFWLWQVKSMEEAIEWLKRCPNPTGEESDVEIRQVFEAEDFGAEFTPELREQEDRLRAQMAAKKSVNAYLTFNGECEAAFKFYEKSLGGKIEAMVPHEGTPAAEHVPAAWHKKILHARMTIGSADLMGSDAPPDRYERPQGISVTLQIDRPAEAERVFAALAEGGTIQMPIQQTFWAARFGMLVDRFGIPWMVNCEQAA